MTTLVGLLSLREHDEDHGLSDDSVSMSWSQVVDLSKQRAAWLEDQRLEGPPHLGVLLPNSVDYLVWIFAASYARWAVVGINPTRRGAALAADIVAADCQLIVTEAASQPMIESLGIDLTPGRILEAEAASRAAATHDGTCDGALAHEDDLLLLLFTSGTTGTPKAVQCTQGRLAGIGETASMAYGYHRDDVCYCPMPLFHGNALMALVAPALYVGASIVLPPRFTASHFLDDVQRHGATMFTYVGKSISYILATPPRPDDRDNALTRGFGTEASATDRVAFEERFGCHLIEGYGASEGGVAIVATPETPKGALGPAPPGTDLAVVDVVTGAEMKRAGFDRSGQLSNGTEAIGELVNRSGVGKFEGYYKNHEAESTRLRNGWYWTGDLAYRDADDYFYFAGRGGDWLRVDSENMAAAPIEEVLARFPAFSNVAVYPVPDPSAGAGDLVMAAVELRDGSFDAESFAMWWTSLDDAGTKWMPTFIRVAEKIDETATGKMTKVRLRHETWHADEPIWHRQPRSASYRLLDAATIKELDDELERRRGSIALP
jgi:fatty-acyl-CoA synthase